MKNKIWRLTSRFLSVLLVLAMVVSITPTDIHAEETDSDPIIVVSLGDSYSSGEGIEPFYGQDKKIEERVTDKDWLAHRSKKSWPSLLEIPGVDGTMGGYRADYGSVSDECQWYFGAVSGAETKHFSTVQQDKPYVKDLEIFATQPIYITGTEYLPLQLDIFSRNDIEGKVDYVTLTVGGNDVGFADIVKTCVTGSTYLGSTTLEEKLNTLWENIDIYAENLRNTYEDVANAAGSQATIIVAGYPKLFEQYGAGAPISVKEADLVNDSVSRFNYLIESLVNECQEAGINIHFVDVEDEFDGHEAYSDEAWINKIWLLPKEQDIDDLAIGSSYSVHPNELGAQAYARCVNAKIQEIEDSKKAGTLSGRIVKASDRSTPVADATVHVIGNNSTKSFVPDRNGNYSVNLPVGTYLVKVIAEGYIEFNAYATIEENQTVYMETFLMVEGEETDIGTADGIITNALTGNGIEGVTLDVRHGWSNADVGDILTTITTDASGKYTVTLPIGNYTLCANKDGYISTMINIVVQANMCTSKNGSLTPIISGDNFRIVLTWGSYPSDLDSHLVGALSSGESFHVYFGNKSAYDGDTEVCNLDVDDTTSYGPETITLNTITDSPYYYYIYDWSNSYEIASSGAQINVYQGETLVATFNVPTDQGNDLYWNVFAIVNGELVVSNTITSGANLSYADTASGTAALDMGLDVEADMAATPKKVVD